jgi:PAS domain S-box-containing protein
MQPSKEPSENSCNDEEKYRNIIHDAPIAIYEVDFSGSKVRAVNPAVSQMIGYSEQELLEMNPLDLLAGDSKKKFFELVKEALTGRDGLFSAEYNVKTKNGQTIWALLDAKVNYKDGKPDTVQVFARDITERKKIEQSLRESFCLYRTLFDNSDDGFMLLEPLFDKKGNRCDFRFLKLNRSYEQQTGVKADDILGKLASDVKPELEQEIALIIDDVVKTGKPVYHEVYNKYSDKWYDSYCFPYAKGQVGILFKDITQRKIAEETLRMEKERFEGLADSLPEIVFETDISGKVVFANQRGFEITGYTEEDLGKGFDVFSLIAPQDKEKAIEYFNKFLNNQPTPYYEFIAARKDGSTFPVIISAKLIVDNERPIGIRGIAIDITERKKAEEALRDSEERLKIYLEDSPAAVFVANTDGRFLYANEAAGKLLGYSKEEFLKMAVLDVSFEDERNINLERFNQLKKTGKARGESRFKRKDGSPVFVILNATELPDGNIIANCENITERKSMEKLLQDNERMAAIGQTAGMIGHDIRNPLQAIISELYIAKEVLAQAPESKEKHESLESMNFVEEQVSYINKIVSDLQDYAKQLNPEYSTINLADLIVNMFDTVVLSDNIKIKVDVARTLKLKTDATFVKRAITNLVINAIQAMPDGGELGLAAQKKEECVVICVSDTGQGVPEHVKANLFKPLTTTKSKGQGLGLAVVKRLVEGLNGKVSFESEEGKGTKFTIELPAMS